MALWDQRLEGGAAFVPPSQQPSAAEAIASGITNIGQAVLAFKQAEDKANKSDVGALRLQREMESQKYFAGVAPQIKAYMAQGKTGKARQLLANSSADAIKMGYDPGVVTETFKSMGLDMGDLLVDPVQARLKQVQEDSAYQKYYSMAVVGGVSYEDAPVVALQNYEQQKAKEHIILNGTSVTDNSGKTVQYTGANQAVLSLSDEWNADAVFATGALDKGFSFTKDQVESERLKFATKYNTYKSAILRGFGDNPDGAKDVLSRLDAEYKTGLDFYNEVGKRAAESKSEAELKFMTNFVTDMATSSKGKYFVDGSPMQLTSPQLQKLIDYMSTNPQREEFWNSSATQQALGGPEGQAYAWYLSQLPAERRVIEWGVLAQQEESPRDTQAGVFGQDTYQEYTKESKPLTTVVRNLDAMAQAFAAQPDMLKTDKNAKALFSGTASRNAAFLYYGANEGKIPDSASITKLNSGVVRQGVASLSVTDPELATMVSRHYLEAYKKISSVTSQRLASVLTTPKGNVLFDIERNEITPAAISEIMERAQRYFPDADQTQTYNEVKGLVDKDYGGDWLAAIGDQFRLSRLTGDVTNSDQQRNAVQRFAFDLSRSEFLSPDRLDVARELMKTREIAKSAVDSWSSDFEKYRKLVPNYVPKDTGADTELKGSQGKDDLNPISSDAAEPVEAPQPDPVSEPPPKQTAASSAAPEASPANTAERIPTPRIRPKKAKAAPQEKARARTEDAQKPVPEAEGPKRETKQKQTAAASPASSAPASRNTPVEAPVAHISEAERVSLLRAYDAAATLRETIGTAESNQSYNAVNRGTIGKKIIGSDLNATRTVQRNGSQVTLPIQELTIGEIRSFHSIDDPNDKDRIFATGYYQVIPSTFEAWLKTRPDIKEDTVLSPELQDDLGSYLYNVRRPAVGAYIKGQSNDLDKALLQLAQEWASFPIPYDITRNGKTYKKGESYYGGANKAHVSLAEAKQALQESRQAYLDKFKNVPTPRPRLTQDKITIRPGAEPEKQSQRNLEALGEEAKRYLAEAERTNDLAKWKEAAAKQRELIQSLLGQ